MLKKIYITISAALLSLVYMVSTASAAVVVPPIVTAVNVNDVFSYTVVSASGEVPFSHTFTFNSNFTGDVKFDVDTSNPVNGVRDLLFSWTTGSGNSYLFTDNAGVEDTTMTPFWEAMVSGQQYVLTVTGTFFGDSNYSIGVSAVPLPPAVIAFSTAMLGVGFLARRRRKQKALFS